MGARPRHPLIDMQGLLLAVCFACSCSGVGLCMDVGLHTLARFGAAFGAACRSLYVSRGTRPERPMDQGSLLRVPCEQSCGAEVRELLVSNADTLVAQAA